MLEPQLCRARHARRPRGTRCARTVDAFADRGYARSKSGSPTCVHQRSRQKRIANRLLSRVVATQGRIRISSMRSLNGMIREARRNLDGRWWQRLRGEAAPSCDRARRPFRCHRVGHRLSTHNRSDAGAIGSPFGRTDGNERFGKTMPLDGRQDHHSLQGQCWRACWRSRGSRCSPPQSRCACVPRPCRPSASSLTRSACLQGKA